MSTVLTILAGGLGALARYGLGGLVQRRTRSARPWGTATVNVTGAAVLGAVIAADRVGHMNATDLYVLGTGFAGGFTTFSTWMVESVRLGEQPTVRGLITATVNLVGMLSAGLAAFGATVWLVRLA